MSDPICGTTLVGLCCASLVTLIALPLWPMIAVAFEAGLFIGVLLHLSHSWNHKL